MRIFDIHTHILPGVDAGLAATIFHFGKIKIPDLKAKLCEAGISVRYTNV